MDRVRVCGRQQCKRDTALFYALAFSRRFEMLAFVLALMRRYLTSVCIVDGTTVTSRGRAGGGAGRGAGGKAIFACVCGVSAMGRSRAVHGMFTRRGLTRLFLLPIL